MALDLERWSPAPRVRSEVVMGWAGSPGNLHHLERLEPVLGEVLRRHPTARLAVLCGERPRLAIPFDYQPFQAGTEHRFTQGLDIGLLPLVFEEHARGKSPIKAVQYLACGVPVVGNVQGATAEICTPDNSLAVSRDAEWVEALSLLIRNPDEARRLGAAGRRHALEHNDLRRNGERLLHCLA
jgi:glycosyltransferase involved in cell wall biosynthesis